MNNHPDYFICVTTLCRRCLLTKHGKFVCLQCLSRTRPALDTEFSTHVKFNGRRANKVTKQNNLHFISDQPILFSSTFYFAFDFFWTNYKRDFHNHTYKCQIKWREKANKSVSNFKCLSFGIFFTVRFF